MTVLGIKIAKAGRDLDGLVAEKLLGYTRKIAPPDGNRENGGNEFLVPANWEYLLEQGYDLPKKGPIHFAFMAPQSSTDLHAAVDLAKRQGISITPTPRGWHASRIFVTADADTLPLAVCVAALRVADVDVGITELEANPASRTVSRSRR